MGIYEKIVNNMEVSVSVGILSVEIFTPNLRELWWIFLFEILHFTMYFK